MNMRKLLTIWHTHHHTSRGASLLELIIYIAIVSFIMVIVSSTFISITSSSWRVDLRAGVNSNIRFAVDKIVKDVKNATTLTVPVMVNATSSTLSMVIAGDTVLYDVVSGQLRRSVNAVPTTITSSTMTVSAIEFKRIENYNTVRQATTTSVRVVVTMRTNTQVGSYVYTDTLTTTATMR